MPPFCLPEFGPPGCLDTPLPFQYIINTNGEPLTNSTTRWVIPIYIIIALFFLFLVVFLAYYFMKAGIGFDLDFRTSTKLPQKLPQGLGEEMRIHPRADINWPVSLETSDGTIVAELRNISLGGAFICCQKPLPMGQVFCMSMLGPDNTPMTATAVVVWSNANLPNEKVIYRGMGVRFINMSERHIELMRQILQKNS
jgi:hypothetical protein